jgi:GGDEF domain-containing protein
LAHAVPGKAVITGNQLEVLVGLVLGLDAVVIAGIVISRLTSRRTKRNGAAGSANASLAVQEAPYSRLARAVGSSGSSSADAAPIETSAFAQAPPSVAGSAEVARDAFTPPPTVDSAPAPVPVAESAPIPAPIAESGPAPAPTEPEGPSIDDIPPFDASDGLEATEALESGDDLEREPPDIEEAPATIPPRAATPPVGIDFGPTWVDPLTLAATAAAEWRHGLRRDLARAAHRGRPSTVMHLKLDIESRPDLGIQDVAHLEGLLLDVLSSHIRANDHVDRTGPARFHMILSEMPEAAALAVAERLRHAFAESAQGAPRLLIGWAAMETEADIAAALQRAAESVDDGGSSAWDPRGQTPA